MIRHRIVASLTVLFLAAVSATTVSAQARGDNIRVRGHWKIGVKNPDQSTVRQIEFDNEFLGDGSTALITLLTGLAQFGRWEIVLRSTPRAELSPVFGDTNSASILPEGRPQDVGGVRTFYNLGVTPSLDNAGYWFLTLHGSVMADAEGVLHFGLTRLETCPVEGPTRCNDYPFSATNIPDSTPPLYPDGSPMPDGLLVKPGQTVDITVEIRFGPAPHGPSHD
jgi:hypothetical protein